MKKLYRLLAAVFTLTLIAASPAAAIESHALGLTGEPGGAWEYQEQWQEMQENKDLYEWPDGYWDDSSSSDSGSSYSEPSYSEPSYDSGSSDSGSGDSGESYSAPSGDSGNGGGTATAPSGLATKGNTKTIEGYETFRQVNKAKDGRVAIYHCGIEQYTAQLMDAGGNAVAFWYANLYQDTETGKFYLNIVTEDGVDTTGYTVGTWKGSIDYLPELGLNGVTLNGVVVAEPAATAETAE